MEAIPHTFHLLLRTSSTFRQVFGRSVRIQRDLHHVLTNARKLPHAISHGQPYASYIAGEVQIYFWIAIQRFVQLRMGEYHV